VPYDLRGLPASGPPVGPWGHPVTARPWAIKGPGRRQSQGTNSETPHARTDGENSELFNRELRHNNTTPFTRGHMVLRSGGSNHVNLRVHRIPG
jgi:hypothetical protein